MIRLSGWLLFKTLNRSETVLNFTQGLAKLKAPLPWKDDMEKL